MVSVPWVMTIPSISVLASSLMRLANASHTSSRIRYADGVSEAMIGLLHDPQTSGGLLIAVPADRAEDLKTSILASGALVAAEIGEVRPRQTEDPWLDYSR